MARVTIDDCLERTENRFVLVIAAAKRARQIHQGSRRLVPCSNKEVVSALREIAAGYVVVREPASREAAAEPGLR